MSNSHESFSSDDVSAVCDDRDAHYDDGAIRVHERVVRQSVHNNPEKKVRSAHFCFVPVAVMFRVLYSDHFQPLYQEEVAKF
jgi:hypothetical protein